MAEKANKLECNIRVTRNSADRINAAIGKVEGNAYTRTADARDVAGAVDVIQQRLDRMLPRKDQTGLSFHVDQYPHGTFGGQYPSPKSTQFDVERKQDGWALTGVQRTWCHVPGHSITPQGLENKGDQLAAFAAQPTKWDSSWSEASKAEPERKAEPLASERTATESRGADRGEDREMEMG